MNWPPIIAFSLLHRSTTTTGWCRSAAREGVVDNAVHFEAGSRECAACHRDVVPVTPVRELLAVTPCNSQNAALAAGTIARGEVGFLRRISMGRAGKHKHHCNHHGRQCRKKPSSLHVSIFPRRSPVATAFSSTGHARQQGTPLNLRYGLRRQSTATVRRCARGPHAAP